MVFAARVAEVVIASPDDTDRFRPAIGQALNWWNAASGQRHEIVLMPSGGQHRTAGAERLNPSAESAQIVDRSDVFIAVFDPARRDVVQVMGDVDRAQRAGKLVLAWLLAESPPSPDLSADDQAWVGDVTQRLSKAGVIPRYLGQGDAHFESRLQTAITADLTHRNLGKLATEFERASPARRLRIYRTPVALLGPQIWAVTVVNHSASLVVGLQVSVGAVDSEGRARPGGAKRSRQAIAEVVAKLGVGRWPDEHHPLSDPRGAVPARQPIFLGSRMDLLAAHNILDFPRWLRPDQHASALYSLEPDASPNVRIRFEDEAGDVWSRVNDTEPERVSSKPSSSAEPRHAGVTGE
ncbi:hypothetical protein MRAB57_2981 [Mycobacterium rhizamassiliense]|uniref:Uncharacterized protein n=2 Tax=Mycobacterium TaxID=1763 RepID=A0A2U3PB66_9MYCO|nr:MULTISPECIES: hypothetical protein [Mycobacterium]SPM35160.1 hypothetical protein MRAB57_2981 [Mycobacterium rhizamassiliense]SPM40989.1 hypothetical protein MNAB215_3190 [Mycobacterium numidiamassiliense]